MMIITPNTSIENMSIEERVALVKESNGYLIDILKDCIIFGNLNLSTLEQLTHIPKMTIDGNLSVKYCENLKTVDKKLNVTQNITFYECYNLRNLPEAINLPYGYLYLKECKKLRRLPKNMYIGKDLDLFDCTGLRSLPKGLKIRGCLCLDGCTNIRTIPNDIELTGKMSAENCYIERYPKRLDSHLETKVTMKFL